MIQNCKICGVKDSQTLKYITNHKYPPKMIGFICNWPKSKRFVSDDQLKELLKIDKKGKTTTNKTTAERHPIYFSRSICRTSSTKNSWCSHRRNY